jgi:hypothetical protein
VTPQGFERALRSFARRRPFLPYSIEFVSGDLLQIAHPEAADIRGNVVLHIAPDGRQRLFDSWSVCQLLDSRESAVQS